MNNNNQTEPQTHFGELHQLFDVNFVEYSSYVIRERAIPEIVDGLKPVQRRLLQTLHNMDDGRYHKVANVVGETMKLHPHGDASIFTALVNLANKGYLIDRQGNFGNIYTGDQASAPRYIECRLSPMARETLFNKDLTIFEPSYDGRMEEPVSLPAKIPLLLMQGADGIAVGMATKIMPHNFGELLEAQIAILQGRDFVIYPDFQQGGIIDVSHYQDGNGKIRIRARIEEKNDKTITIKEIPFTTTTQSLIDSIEKAAKSNRIKIQSIDDYTAEEVEIEIKLPRNIFADDTIRALYAFTDCEIPLSPNLTVIRENHPVIPSVSEVLRGNTAKLVSDLHRELEIERDRLRERLHAHLLEQIFIEKRLYKKIEECETYDAVIATIDQSLKPYAHLLVREVTLDDMERLLEIRIRRITRYDIDKKQKEIDEVRTKISEIEKDLTDVTAFTIRYIKGLLKKYGSLYPRRTEIMTFGEIEAREVALSNLTMIYNRKSGFLGHGVKEEADMSFACSEYDKFLLIFRSGRYKVLNVCDKVFIGHDLHWMGKVESGLLFNLIYRDGEEGYSYIKRFRMPKFIIDREYQLFPAHKLSEIQHLSLGENKIARIYLTPSRRAKSNYIDCPFDTYLVKGSAALGKRISSRPVRRIVYNETTPPAPVVTPKPQTLFDRPDGGSVAGARDGAGATGRPDGGSVAGAKDGEGATGQDEKKPNDDAS